MNRPSRRKRARIWVKSDIIRSGDYLADWFFRQFKLALESGKIVLARKRRLIDPDYPQRGVLRGLMDPEVHPKGKLVQITINPAKNTHLSREEEVDTLIHELAHFILPKSSERSILAIENSLARKLSRAQRRYLKSFLPRHEVKTYPIV